MNSPPNAVLIALLAEVVFFEGAGAVIGHWHDDLRGRLRQMVERKGRATRKEADDDSERGWERVEFFHGHGFQMLLLTIFLVFAAANLGLPLREQTLLSWGLVGSSALYSLGWLFSGVFTPRLGRKRAKDIASRWFFLPFGLLFILSSCLLLLLALLQPAVG